MNTNDLIDVLAKDLAPVEPLPRPWKRAARWLLAAMAYVAITAAAMAWWNGTLAVQALPVVPQLLALLAGALAAEAACASSVPGYRRHAFIVPTLAVGLWVITMGSASPNIVASQVAAARHEWLCVAQITIGALPLLALLVLMLRRGAAVRPASTGALAAVAVGMFAHAGACYSASHPDAGVTLIWHGGTVLVFALLCASAGRYLLRWRPVEPR